MAEPAGVEGGSTSIVELHEDGDGYLHCPRRGRIDAEWCLGCPRTLRVTYDGDRAVVVCDPGHGPHHDQPTTLPDVPEPFRTS